MKRKSMTRGLTWWVVLRFVGIAFAIVAFCNSNVRSKEKETKLTYPNTHRCDQVDDYHGTKIADPYRWLEDTDSEQTKSWVKAQNRVTFAYLDKIPARQKIEERLTKLWNYERYGLPTKRGGRYFYTHNNGLQNQSVLYVAEGLDAESRVLLDPNKLSQDGTVALASWVPSEDGNFVAVALASDGSDWREWKVLDVDSGMELADHVHWSKFSSASWTREGKGFFYSRYDEPQEGKEFTGTNYFQKLYYHRLGELQAEDTLIYERTDEKEWGFDGRVTEDGRYLMVRIWRGTEEKYQVFYKDLQSPGSKVIELITGFDAEYVFIANEGPVLWFMTDLDAPLRRVIAIDTTRPDRESWNEVIPEATHVLRGISLVGERFFASYLKDAQTLVKVYAIDGRYQNDVKLPATGSAGGFGGRRSDQETFYAFTNYTTPTQIYRYDIESGKSEIFRKPDVDVNPDNYMTRQVFYESNDGTRVPMFITHRRDVKPNGSNPTVLYGYGGFNNSLSPSFRVTNMVWLEAGGIYAVPNLRGGGEYGRQWHEAGIKDRKQNVFDDFIAAAEWLIDNKYTSRKELAIRGGSNGGLLVGAAMTQRPDLFGAALPAVGVLDMLRYHKFTIGWAWVSEYGSSDNLDEFKTLFSYSPLHNLKSGTKYPATMITTGDHDDRVVPGHSFKFAAQLQTCHVGVDPVLIRIETSAGHGAGTPTTKRIQAATDVLAFLSKELQVEF